MDTIANVLNDMCHGISDEMGAITGAIYDYGATTVAGPVVGTAVGEAVGGAVQHGWPSVCDLPGNIIDYIDAGPGGLPYFPDSGLT